MPHHKEGMQRDEEWNWEQEDPESYHEESEAYGLEDEEDDLEETGDLEGSVMQVEMLPIDDNGQGQQLVYNSQAGE
eukprot:4296456-Prorocentrum_lima.AAC.1